MTKRQVLTEHYSKESLDYVLTTVMRQKPDSFLTLALSENGIDNVMNLLTISDEEVDKLQYTDATTKTKVAVHTSQVSLVRAFRAYIQHQNNPNLLFNTIELADFDHFRITDYAMYDKHAMIKIPEYMRTSIPKNNILQEFRKAAKRDKSQYSDLKEEKQWDNWYRSTISTARSHGCEHVFDPQYKPETSEDIAIFDEVQKFMYSVFDAKLHTDVGKDLVQTYFQTYDAQTIFKKLQEHATKSTHASITSSQLLTYITSTLFHDSKWTGTSHGFIIHWLNQLRLYENLVKKEDHFTDPINLAMLQNVVSGTESLHRVKTQSDHDVARGELPLTFENYKTLLLSAAATLDERNKVS